MQNLNPRLGRDSDPKNLSNRAEVLSNVVLTLNRETRTKPNAHPLQSQEVKDQYWIEVRYFKRERTPGSLRSGNISPSVLHCIPVRTHSPAVRLTHISVQKLTSFSPHAKPSQPPSIILNTNYSARREHKVHSGILDDRKVNRHLRRTKRREK